MPTQENLEGLRSENAEKAVRRSGTSGSEALATAKPSIKDMPTPTANEMSQSEALAIAWTGIEVLARMKQANLYRSPKSGRVVIELLATELTADEGLKPLAVKR